MTIPLRAENLHHRHANSTREVLRGVSLRLLPGERCALIGPNGCGKSTLLHILAGLLRPDAGTVHLDGAPVGGLGRRECASRAALMPQSLDAVPGIRTGEFVAQGRYTRAGTWGMMRSPRGGDPETTAALDLVGLSGMAERRLDRLSGGQRQRARLALALRQGAGLLLLDEPLAHLDIAHRFGVLRAIDDAAARRSLTVLAVLHELDHAARWADRLLVLHRGRIHAAGTPAEVLRPALLAEVFGIDAGLDDAGRLTVRGPV